MKNKHCLLVILSCLTIFTTSALAHEILSLRNAPKNLIKIPMTRQASDFTCGVAAVQSVMQYYGDEYHEGGLSKELQPSETDGTAYQQIKKIATNKGYQVKIYYNMSLQELKTLIDKGLPVIVLLQAWPNKKVIYAHDWDDGHYAVAIGYDKQNIYFMDPSTLGNYTYISTNEFLTRWHDMDKKEKVIHFGMTITKSTPKPYDANAIMHMD